MKLYAVMLDDVENCGPFLITDDRDVAEDFCTERMDKYHDYEVLEYELNKPEEFEGKQVFATK